MAVFHKLKIKEIIRETADAVSIVLDIPADLNELFQYKSGQYITFKVDVKGEKINRSYSLCSSPYNDESAAIAVKEVKGGKVSTHFNQHAKVGDEIEAMPPMGNFIAEPIAGNANHYILFGAGSGITPLYSILKTILKEEPNSKVTLFFGNFNSDTVIFKEGLLKLANEYSRLKVVHVFDAPKKKGGFLGFGKKAVEELNFIEGKITQSVALQLLREQTDLNFQNALFYMCGPSGMMDSVGGALSTLSINPDKIFREYFTEKASDEKTATDVGTADADFAGEAKVHVIYDGKEFSFEMKEKSTILDAALDANVDPPFACMVGACTTCRAKLTEGQVHMDDSDALTPGEVEAGYVLTCQSHPKSSVVKINYDE